MDMTILEVSDVKGESPNVTVKMQTLITSIFGDQGALTYYTRVRKAGIQVTKGQVIKDFPMNSFEVTERPFDITEEDEHGTEVTKTIQLKWLKPKAL